MTKMPKKNPLSHARFRHTQCYITDSTDDFACYTNVFVKDYTCKGKGLPQQAEVAQGVPGRLRSWIFLTFGTMRVAGRQSYAPAAFTVGEIPGTHF
jgi:hypothetical protein